MAGSILIVALHVHTYTTTSPIDELSHIDTLIKTSRFEVVEEDERVGQEAMREEACRGLDRGEPVPPCDTPTFNPQEFHDYGVNIISTRFPVYHLLTGIPARVMTWAPGVDSIVGPARLLGGVWLGAGLFLAWLIMRELRVPVRTRALVLPLLATTPVVLHAHSIVNSDATLMFSGAAVIYLTLRFERGTTPAWFVLVASGLGLLLEPTTLLAVTLCGLYLLGRGIARRGAPEPADDPPSGRPAWESSLVGGATLAMGVVVFVALPVVHQAVIGTATVPSDPVTQAEADAQHQAPEVSYGSVPAGRILGEIAGLVTPVKRPYVPAFLAGDGAGLLVSISDWLLLGAVLGVAALGARRSRAEAMAVAALVVMLGAGPLHALWNARRDVFFAIPTRFGLPILPLLFALLAVALRKPVAVGAVGAVSIASTVYALVHLV